MKIAGGLVAALFVSVAHAEQCRWYYLSTQHAPGGEVGAWTPEEVCPQWAQYRVTGGVLLPGPDGNYHVEGTNPLMCEGFYPNLSGTRYTARVQSRLEECPVEPQCPVGDYTYVTVGGSLLDVPSKPLVCEGSCQVQVTDSVELVGTGYWVGLGTYTGRTCDTSEVGHDQGDGIGSAPPGCIVGQTGVQVCFDAVASGCGTVNGQMFCADDLPDRGRCEFLANGSFICDGSSPPRPPHPDAPVDGSGAPAASDTVLIDLDGSGGGGPGRYSVGQGSPTGSGDGDRNLGEPGTCTPDPNDPASCGNLVKIDESGTPYGEADVGGGDGLAALDAQVEGIDGGLPDDFPAPPEWRWGIGGGQSCTGIPWSFRSAGGTWAGYCQFWDGTVKPALAFFLALLTVIHVWGVWRAATRGA